MGGGGVGASYSRFWTIKDLPTLIPTSLIRKKLGGSGGVGVGGGEIIGVIWQSCRNKDPFGKQQREVERIVESPEMCVIYPDHRCSERKRGQVGSGVIDR